MESAVTIGLDLGKSVFQLHGVDRQGKVVVQRRTVRARLLAFCQCLIGVSAALVRLRKGALLRRLGPVGIAPRLAVAIADNRLATFARRR
jgi:transposase